LAGSFLSELGFKLVDDPSLIQNPYQMTAATYKSNSGFFLCVGFDPLDSNSASVTCGRQWRVSTGWSVLSNRYAAVAKRLGIYVPIHYSLGYGDEIPRTMERILDDLRRTLPVVKRRTTLEDLIAVESEAFGARKKAARYFGPDNLGNVEVSDYKRVIAHRDG
jgi:hypothetical protein